MRAKVREELLKFWNRVDHVTNMSDLRLVEANAPIPYWTAWHFTLKTAGRHFPNHWRDFNMCGSTITVGNRNAFHLFNAMLNYGYAILARQLQRALDAWGFDVCLGTLHADFEGRPSLVCDLIEPLRPVMDSKLLIWATTQTWRRSDFVVDSLGVVSLLPALAKMVVAKSAIPESAVADSIRFYKRILEP